MWKLLRKMNTHKSNGFIFKTYINRKGIGRAKIMLVPGPYKTIFPIWLILKLLLLPYKYRVDKLVNNTLYLTIPDLKGEVEIDTN